MTQIIQAEKVKLYELENIQPSPVLKSPLKSAIGGNKYEEGENFLNECDNR